MPPRLLSGILCCLLTTAPYSHRAAGCGQCLYSKEKSHRRHIQGGTLFCRRPSVPPRPHRHCHTQGDVRTDAEQYRQARLRRRSHRFQAGGRFSFRPAPRLESDTVRKAKRTHRLPVRVRQDYDQRLHQRQRCGVRKTASLFCVGSDLKQTDTARAGIRFHIAPMPETDRPSRHAA